MASPRHIEQVVADGVIIGKRLRPLNEDAVQSLMKSIADIGLQTPITVRVLTEMEVNGRKESDVPVLVAGAHRLEAVKRLGRDFIDAYVFEGDERDARMWEIAENLHRADLTVLERAEQVSEWVRLAETKPRQAAAVSVGGRGNTGGRRAAAREIGVDEREARRAEKVAALTPEAKETARAVGLDDNQSALLDAAKAETAAAQVEVLNRRAAERARTHMDVKDAKSDALETAARIIAEDVHEEHIPVLASALALRGDRELAARIQALTGAVFDKGRVSEAA